MIEINLEDFTEFSKIKDIWNNNFHDKNALHEFLNNVVMNMEYGNGYGKMLHNFSDLYVLVSKENFPFGELTLNQKISIDLGFLKKSREAMLNLYFSHNEILDLWLVRSMFINLQK